MFRLRLVILIVTLCSVFQQAESQVNKSMRDSLSILLSRHTAKDTQRVLLLNRYARVARHDNPDTAMLLTEEGLLIANNLKSKRWIAQLLATKSMIFSKENQYDSSIEYGTIAAKMLKQEKMFLPYLTILNIIAENYSSKGEFSKAIDIFYEVINTARTGNDKNNYGSAYGNIGSIYLNFGLYRKAIENYERALAVFQDTKDSVLIGSAMANLGLAHNGLMESSKAMNYLRRSLDIFRLLNRVDVIPDIKSALALSYSRGGRPMQAIPLLIEALNYSKATGNTYSAANAHIVLATANKIIGDSTHNKQSFTDALHHAAEGLRLSTEIKEAVLRSRALEELSQIYFRLGSFEEAYKFQDQYISLRDSIAGENRRQEIAIKEAEFNNLNEKALLIAKHQAALVKQRNIRNLILVSGALVLLTGIIIFIFYKRYEKSNVLRIKSELKAEMTDLEMKALRSQMNPHFIFNCLNSIADYISRNKVNEARDYLTKFAKLMRMILEHSDQKEVSLAKDIEALKTYMELETLRFENKPEYNIVTDEDVDMANTYLPSLLLQPFVENCFKHGFRQPGEKGKIEVRIKNDNTHLHCIIEDNGIGRSNSQKNINLSSYGLSITQSRINSLHKSGNNKGSFKITDLPKGTRVDVFIPY